MHFQRYKKGFKFALGKQQSLLQVIGSLSEMELLTTWKLKGSHAGPFVEVVAYLYVRIRACEYY